MTLRTYGKLQNIRLWLLVMESIKVLKASFRVKNHALRNRFALKTTLYEDSKYNFGEYPESCVNEKPPACER